MSSNKVLHNFGFGLGLLSGVSALTIMATMPAAAQEAAQEAAEEESRTLDTIVVTGIRASMQNAMDMKRDASGVLDAISAEDIGKFPDTNLAESLQRITGVSIDRQNGEGSAVTVRGFGPGFNLVTFNGRTLPTADIEAVGSRGNYGIGGGRNFDFSNLASEGVSALEVYKTGQAILPTGGIGATINIVTRKPLDTDGFDATVQAKFVNDTSVEAGDSITPELSGVMNWSNDAGTFGVGVFGSYSKRDSGAPTMQINDWITREAGADGSIDSSYLRGDGSTVITNGPEPGQLYAIAQDSRYDFSDIERERINGQLVLQYRPMDALTLTADYTVVANESSELRYEQTNWFATPMDQITFAHDGPVATAIFMQENNNGSKDIGFEQTDRATKDQLQSLGFGAEWELNDSMSVIFDGHTSKGKSAGNNPLGHIATFVTFGAPVIQQHSVDYSSGYPVQSYTTNDSVRGNGNGVLDSGDLGTQVQRSNTGQMTHDVDEFDLRFVWENDNSSLTVGANRRNTEMNRIQLTTQQDLGSWGIGNPGDVEQFAPGLVEQFCISCTFDDLSVGQGDIAFKSSPTELFPLFQAAYAGNAVTTGSNDNTVSEDITSLFAQFGMESEFMTKPVRLNAGFRYEETDVEASTVQTIPTGIIWGSDNDFLVTNNGGSENLAQEASYDHLLPNFDFSIDLTDNLVARASYSKTIGRVGYSQLFASTTADAPNRPTALGGTLTGSSQNPGLLPLESENYDVSLEWYYGDASYVSVGYFNKDVQNFTGQGVVERNLFGLRDPASGAAGSVSGQALDLINGIAGVDQSEANLFTMSALIIKNGGDQAAASAEFQAALGTDGALATALPQSYVDQVATDYDITSAATDPLATFAVQQPTQDNDGNIHGYEFAVQHFFGDTGFGLSANYTVVDGDVVLDPGASINENQFALVGLSDSANFAAIYEKYGLSARLTYNWRDTYLTQINQGGDRSGIYAEDYGQFDMNVSYEVNDHLGLSFEAINLTGEDQRQYHRVTNQVYYAYELSPRFVAGVRYKF